MADYHHGSNNKYRGRRSHPQHNNNFNNYGNYHSNNAHDDRGAGFEDRQTKYQNRDSARERSRSAQRPKINPNLFANSIGNHFTGKANPLAPRKNSNDSSGSPPLTKIVENTQKYSKLCQNSIIFVWTVN